MTFGVLAAAAPASDNVTPGLLGFLVFAVMAVALVFLLKSMNKQFRKITPGPGPGPAGAATAAPDDPAKPETPR